MLSLIIKCLKEAKQKAEPKKKEENKKSHWFDAVFGEGRRWKGSKDQHSYVQVGQSYQEISH